MLILFLLAAFPSKTAPSASAAFRPPFYVNTPVLNSAVSSDKGVKLTWDYVYGAEKYRVFVKNGSSWKGLGNTTANYFYHTAAVSGKTYTYTIRCISADGSYFTSDFLPAGKTVTYIKMPIINKLSCTESGVSIGWDAVGGAAKYRVFIKNGTSWKKIGDTTGTSFEHNNLVSGTVYTYTVRCISANGKSFTSAYQTSGKKITFVKAPIATSIENEPTGVRIKWDACKGAERYRVFIKSDGKWKTIAETEDTSYLHYADNDTEYTYTLRCFNAKGKAVSGFHEEGWTNTYSFTGMLDAPVITNIENTQYGARIKWNPVEGAEKYRVLLRGYYTWTLLGDTTATELTHTSAVSGTEYTYTVCCIDSNATRNTSVYDNNGTSNTFIRTPSIIRIANTANGPLIAWESSGGASKYRLVTEQNGVQTVLCDTVKTDYIYTGAEENVKYTYKVYCLDENNNPLNVYPETGKAAVCVRDPNNLIYTNELFAMDVSAAIGKEYTGVGEPCAPLSRVNAAEILVRLLHYRKRTNIKVSDTDDQNMLTIAYYGYFTPDSVYRVLPTRYISTADYSRIMGEVNRYAKLKGKRILAFGDSIMYGKGNSGGGCVRMLAEKYGMGYTSYAYNGASFGLNNNRRHISDEISDANNAGHQADLIIINGGTNDMSLVAKGSDTDFFDPRFPDNSTLAAGLKQSMEYLNKYWNGVPVIYVRSHNMNICSDTLERQMGEYTVTTAANFGAHIVDVYSDTTLNTKSSTQTQRYTGTNSNPEGDGIHPNALGYGYFYLPLLTEKTEQIFAP